MGLTNADHGKFDLNLLRVFNELYQHRNSSEAAKRLGITRPAVSNALKRLREQLDDPLFLRVGNAFEPTARANQLGENLDEQLRRLLNTCYPPALFDPATFSGNLRIALSANLSETLGSALTVSLLRQLPRAKIKLLHWSETTIDKMEQGEIEIGLNHFPMNISKGIRQIPVTSDPGVLLMRGNNPFAGIEPSLEMLTEHALAGLLIPGANEYQPRLEEQLKTHQFNFAVRSESISDLFEAVLQADLLSLMPALPASMRPKGIICTSLENSPWFPHANLYVAIYFHQRNHQQPMYQWLEAHLRQVINNCADKAKMSMDS